MNPVIITVRGESEVRSAPERANIRLSVRCEAPSRTDVVEQALRLAEPVRDSITARRDAGTVAEWTSKQLTVRAERPWSSDAERLALVYHAAVDFTATFTDASELSIWVSEISAWDGLDVGSVHWHLTRETLTRIEREVASSAVAVAVARAEAYAGALGLANVTPLEIADAGLISSGQHPAAPPMMNPRGAAFSVMAESGASMEYEPDDIVVAATVEGRFSAS